MKKLSFSLSAVLLGLFCASQSFAITITFAPGVSDTATSSIATCSSPYTGLTYQGCVTNGFVSDTVATSTSPFISPDTFGAGQGFPNPDSDFMTAFSNALGGNWTLNQDTSTVMDDVNLQVTNFSTGSYTTAGGIGVQDDGHYIQVAVQGLDTLSQSLINQLVWIQGLEINYTPGSADANYNTGTTYNTLDDASFNGLTTGCIPIPAGAPASIPATDPGTNYCDPIYPFQAANLSFFDAPMGPWPDGSFRGIALLATVDTTTNTITVYGGVDYGFDNTVAPEPGTWVLLLAGCAAIFFGRRRARARG